MTFQSKLLTMVSHVVNVIQPAELDTTTFNVIFNVKNIQIPDFDLYQMKKKNSER